MKELLYIPGGSIVRFVNGTVPFEQQLNNILNSSYYNRQVTSEYSFLLAIVSGELSDGFYRKYGITLPALLSEFEVIELSDTDS